MAHRAEIVAPLALVCAIAPADADRPLGAADTIR